jgi:chromosome segregation ATPase
VQINNSESQLQAHLESLESTLTSKITLLYSLETKLATFKHSLLSQQQESALNLSQKKSHIDQLTKETSTQKATIAELQQRVSVAVEELQAQKKITEEQEFNASQLYEERMREKREEIKGLTEEKNRVENNNHKLNESIVKLETKMMMMKNKIGNVRSLLKVYDEQANSSSSSDKHNLLGTYPSQGKSLSFSYKALLEELEEESGDDKSEEKIRKLLKEKLEKESEVDRLKAKVGRLDQFVESMKIDNLRMENLIRKFKDFIGRVFNSFSFYADLERIDDPLPTFNDFLSHLDIKNKEREAVVLKAENEIRKLRENLKQKSNNEEKQGAIKTHEKIISELNQKLHEKENELHRLSKELDNLKSKIEENIISESEKDKGGYDDEIEEKDKIIANHKNTLETMRSTILKLRDSLQSKIEEISTKEETIKSLSAKLDQTTFKLTQEIADQKLSLLSTIDSQLSSILLIPSFSSTPSVDALYNSILTKIKSIKNSNPTPPEEKDLRFELKEVGEKLEKKEKELLLMTKQKDTLRSQLGSAVEVLGREEEPRGDLIPSLEKHIRQLQEESRQSESTRDMTEQLIESFERNDRKMREKLEKAKERIKELKRQRGAVVGNEELKAEMAKEIKKAIRAEEIEKRDAEIERQRKVMAKKSEEQSIMFNQKIEELEAKIEGKEIEINDLMVKLQDTESELKNFKISKDKKELSHSADTIQTYHYSKVILISILFSLLKISVKFKEQIRRCFRKFINFYKSLFGHFKILFYL